mgnify:CR=1 FL=1|tara:strand:- start:741 stop:1382 length:642 start_codon:yes stop_codon:yes gene_type:complete
MKKFLILLIALITTPIISFSQDFLDMEEDLKREKLSEYFKFYPPQLEFKGATGKLKKIINETDLFSYNDSFYDLYPEFEGVEYISEEHSDKYFDFLDNFTIIIELSVDELKELTKLSILRNKNCFKEMDFQASRCKLEYYNSGTQKYEYYYAKRGKFDRVKHLIESAKLGDLLKISDIKVNQYEKKKLVNTFSIIPNLVLKVVYAPQSQRNKE